MSIENLIELKFVCFLNYFNYDLTISLICAIILSYFYKKLFMAPKIQNLPKNRFTNLEVAKQNSPLLQGAQLAWQIVQNRNKPTVPVMIQGPISNSQSPTNNGVEVPQVVTLTQTPQLIIPQNLEQISNFKLQSEDYKNLKMSELTQLINQIKNCVEASPKNQELLRLLQKIKDSYSYKNFGLPETIDQEIDEGYENERNLGQVGEYTAKFLAHNKLGAFLFQLEEISKKVQEEIEALTPTKLVIGPNIEPDIHTAKTVVQAPLPQKTQTTPVQFQALAPIQMTTQSQNILKLKNKIRKIRRSTLDEEIKQSWHSLERDIEYSKRELEKDIKNS